jgi:hypothetical protein
VTKQKSGDQRPLTKNGAKPKSQMIRKIVKINMKKFILTINLLVFIAITSYAQDTLKPYLQLLNYKIQLLEVQVKLLDAKQKLSDVNPQKTDLNLIKDVNSSEKTEKKKPDTASYKPFKSAFKLNPARLFEGTFQISYERALKNNFSIDFSALGTYMSSNGLGSGYMKDQVLYAYDNSLDTYISYNGHVISGWGVALQTRNYLLPRIGSKINAPYGLYASPQFMYRKTWITGYTTEWEDSTWKEKTVKQNLDVFAIGVILGGKFSIHKVICVDIFIGGVWRFSKYANEKELTRNKRWSNIDYSGVLPTAGITIGVMK